MHFKYKRRPNLPEVEPTQEISQIPQETQKETQEQIGVNQATNVIYQLSEAQLKKIIAHETAKNLTRINQDLSQIYLSILGLVSFTFALAVYNLRQYVQLNTLHDALWGIKKSLDVLQQNDQKIGKYAVNLANHLADHMQNARVHDPSPLVDYSLGYLTCLVVGIFIYTFFASCSDGLEGNSSTIPLNSDANCSSLWNYFPSFPEDPNYLESLYIFIKTILKILKDLLEFLFPFPYSIPFDPGIDPIPYFLEFFSNNLLNEIVIVSFLVLDEARTSFLFALIDFITKFF